jgi:hypothetical protein
VKKKTPPIQSEKISIPKKPTKSPSNWNKPKATPIEKLLEPSTTPTKNSAKAAQN